MWEDAKVSHMPELSKSLKREVRTLLPMGYEREVNVELRRLQEEFSSWQAGQFDGFELLRKIRDSVKLIDSEGYKASDRGGLGDVFLARFVADGIIDPSEISQELFDIIKNDVEEIKRNLPEMPRN